jgi:hypothetical protein
MNDSQRDEKIHETNIEVHVVKVKMEALEALVKTFVTRPEFDPVKMITFGMAGSILMAVLGALLVKVIVQ